MVRLKPLKEQVIVVTGASSGIGLATAQMAAEKGARVVMAARSGDDLERFASEIEAAGGQALAVPTDVSDAAAVEALARAAIARFGGIDTWVNDAGVSIFGKIEETGEDEARRLFDVDFWGMVHGCRAALPTLKEHGGALINVGSMAGDVATPLMGYYSAAKHAVRGFTDALRIELEHDGAPVSVTLIKPGPIATPIMDNQRNLTGEEMAMPPPLYPAEDVARVILHAAEHPTRDRYVGGSAVLGAMGAAHFPRLADRMSAAGMEAMTTDEPAHGHPDNLFAPSEATAKRGDTRGRHVRPSLSANAANHPVASGLALLALGVGLGGLMARGRP
ncbi:SDR family oxidoreductase [Parvularcula dongshanensis]|uniref:NADP-dependent 3-hydroxy acid dehydrogenase YdfG n=1 Tax=Parvularcula dongshanensis TaxID=1173995 RepID=A0A840I322_9PROT|nr:SDR family oxidoreductase [Parvularcula dongshanensis]MBB4659406.1 NADP-dependent 3-hydroxy acid dehydrogenase YdfG [Parvularcula dongshanensis]